QAPPAFAAPLDEDRVRLHPHPRVEGPARVVRAVAEGGFEEEEGPLGAVLGAGAVRDEALEVAVDALEHSLEERRLAGVLGGGLAGGGAREARGRPPAHDGWRISISCCDAAHIMVSGRAARGGETFFRKIVSLRGRRVLRRAPRRGSR